MKDLFSLSNNFKSFGYYNLLLNPTFTNTDNWEPINGTESVSNNNYILTGDGTSTAVRVYQTLSNVGALIGKKYYVSTLARATNSLCASIALTLRSDVSGTNIVTVKTRLTPILNNWYTLSGLATLPTWSTTNILPYIYHTYTNAATANGKSIELKEIMVIDLTALFGAGNEPSVVDCKNIFRFVDGTKQPNFSKSFVA